MKKSLIKVPLPGSEYTLHIALANLPQKNSKAYIDHVKERLFDDYKKNSNEYLKGNDKLGNTLFQPLQYYIFGNYDIAFISLVDRFKFSQKLFVPKKDVFIHGVEYDEFDPTAFQVITGICPEINPGFRPEEFFENKTKKENFEQNKFVTICNLKLNNKLLIGNGLNFYDLVVITINDAIQKTFHLDENAIKDKYFIMQSFSWFEITIVLFTKTIDSKDSDLIKEILGGLRILTLKDLEIACIDKVEDCPTGQQIFNNSIYYKEIDSLTGACLNYTACDNFLFSDSHSYVGVHRDLVDNDTGYSEIVTTQIEAQLKPGYLKSFMDNISAINLGEGNKISKPGNPQFLITGKYDYQFQLEKGNIAYNLALIRAITSQGSIQDKFSEFTRKIKTNIIFNYEPKLHDEICSVVDFKKVLKEKFVKKIDIGKINSILKQLKISRLVRGKVVKIFYNYTNTIQDSILFIFILDFVDFINFLNEWIENQGKKFEDLLNNSRLEETTEDELDESTLKSISEFRKVNDIENSLIQFIELFQKGYFVRVLNSYQFEDINDFDLDFNSSPQQVLTTYNTIAKEIQHLFFNYGIQENSNDFPESPLILINLKNTVADPYSINYDVFHLTSPEFVLFTLIKEVLNKYHFVKSNNYYTDISAKCSSLQEKLLRNKYFKSLIASGLGWLDLNNIFIDYIRLGLVFNFEYKMFYTWSWMYNFQNAAMYDEIGLFNEKHFVKELIRILFIGFLSSNEESIENMDCPLPELQIYWDRYFLTNKNILAKMFDPKFQSEEQNIYLEITKFRDSTSNLIKKLSVDFYGTSVNSQSFNGSIVNFNAETNDLKLLFKDAKNVYDKEYKSIIDKLESGKPILFNPNTQSSYIYYFQLSYTYLKYIYEENDQKVHLLRRSWSDGSPLTSYIKYQANNWLYNVDPMGGLFFTNNKNAKKYFRVRNAIMQSLWHFGMILKKKHFFNK